MDIKSALKTIIADFHKRGIPKTIERDIHVPVDSDKIVTLIGARRAGKTYMLYQLMKQIKDITSILYINFEDERLSLDPKDLQLIFDAYFELYPNKKEQETYMFFDEIQEVHGWEAFVRRVYDTITKKIFITGSSAKMLSREIATSLRGRAISYEIYPLSFKEYLRFKGVPKDMASTKGRSSIMHEFESYMQRGGFPETIIMDDDVYQKTMDSYFEVMLYRDIIERHSISNPLLVRELLKQLLSQTAKEFSINKIYNDFKSRGRKISKDSLYEYLKYFEDAFIIIPISNHLESARKQTLRKSYAIDTGLAKLTSLSLSKDFGPLFETVVLINLKQKGKQVFYFRNGDECDFVIKQEDHIKEALQVCYDYNENNKEREIKGLKSAIQRFKLDGGTILTLDRQGQEGNIKIVPIAEWLLN